MKHILNKEKYINLIRRAGAEGIVMLRNENNALPLKKGERISIFGRLQFDYYKSGTGSGGMVNAPYVVSILDGLKAGKDITINEKLLNIYESWVCDNPFDKGEGWAGEPWSQVEMPMTEDIASQAAKDSDAAIIILGRQAGESKDFTSDKGSYLLTDTEEHLIETVCKNFSRAIVVLNTGGIIDMKWVDKYKPSAVLYVWQGGQEGGNGVADVLLGAMNPCGRLADTIAEDIEDYPSTANFGDAKLNYYKEDIYTGYRYFETFARDKVLYPFGFGLSYTSFEICVIAAPEPQSPKNLQGIAGQLRVKHGASVAYRNDAFSDNSLNIQLTVKNTGSVAGKEVVQIYLSAPQGKLGKPSRALIGFTKTKELQPGEKQEISMNIPLPQMASYDDSGATGHKSCYVLEAGKYEIYVGKNVRDAVLFGSFDLAETVVTEKLTEAMSPVRAFERIKPGSAKDIDGNLPQYAEKHESVPMRTYDLTERALKNIPKSPNTASGDKGYKLRDVMQNKVTLEEFTAQLSDDELCCLARGEGQCSEKVIPGSTGTFGGVTDALADYGIPIAVCVDGPSGIRLDSGITANSLPGGTALGCTFNTELVGELFDMLGCEMSKNKIDVILGPGMNIHRNPLCGRNFEYFSEDPLLTGKMAAAQLKGLHKWNVTGTIKHFAANNQEFERYFAEAVVSERALREIYLKGYEIAVREGKALTIMTTYGPVNGIWTAGNFDLCTTILRDEWGFDGMVMTDWWANVSEDGGEPSTKNLAQMVRAQNDVYMLVPDSLTADDNLAEGLQSGAVTRAELLRGAGNICRAIMRLAVGQRLVGNEFEFEQDNVQDEVYDEYIDVITADDGCYNFDISKIDTSMRSYNIYKLELAQPGRYTLTMRYKSAAEKVAQIPFAVLAGSQPIWAHVFNGTDGEQESITAEMNLPAKAFLKLFFSHGGLVIEELSLQVNEA